MSNNVLDSISKRVQLLKASKEDVNFIHNFPCKDYDNYLAAADKYNNLQSEYIARITFIAFDANNNILKDHYSIVVKQAIFDQFKNFSKGRGDSLPRTYHPFIKERHWNMEYSIEPVLHGVQSSRIRECSENENMITNFTVQIEVCTIG